LKESLNIAEQRVSKLRLKSDDERALVSKEFEQQLEMRKEKIIKLKEKV
jgi:hypothetical protein